MKKPVPRAGKKKIVESYLREKNCNTVCEAAKCPNRTQCFGNGTATFLILGNTCTRNCLFCSIDHGIPQLPDSQEPHNVTESARQMNLSYVVVTSVTRDDLADGGAQHFSKTVTTLKNTLNGIKVEILVPDFHGNDKAVATVVESGPDVFNHNIETVPRLFTQIRPQGDYQRSLHILHYVKSMKNQLPVKSGLMVGLGETENEVIDVMKDLYASGVSILTIGQYLQPTNQQVPVHMFVHPQQFDRYENAAYDIGFTQVVAGPYVRSSYNAAEFFLSMKINHSKTKSS